MDQEKIAATVWKNVAAVQGTSKYFAKLRNKLLAAGVGGSNAWSWEADELAAVIDDCLVWFGWKACGSFPSPVKHRVLRADIFEICNLGEIQTSAGFMDLASFLDAVAAGEEDEVSLWERLYTYVQIRFQTPHEPVETDDYKAATVTALHQQWSSNFFGESLFALKDKLRVYDTRFQQDNSLYGRIMSIIQSSGTGGSRLVNELGGTVFGICFSLRDNDSSGFPPGDPEVVKFLKAGWDLVFAMKHARLVCFLGADVKIGKTQRSGNHG